MRWFIYSFDFLECEWGKHWSQSCVLFYTRNKWGRFISLIEYWLIFDWGLIMETCSGLFILNVMLFCRYGAGQELRFYTDCGSLLSLFVWTFGSLCRFIIELNHRYSYKCMVFYSDTWNNHWVKTVLICKMVAIILFLFYFQLTTKRCIIITMFPCIPMTNY